MATKRKRSKRTQRNRLHEARVVRLTKTDIVMRDVVDITDPDEIAAALEKYNYSEELGYGLIGDS